MAETSVSNRSRLRQGFWGLVLAAAQRLFVFMTGERRAQNWWAPGMSGWTQGGIMSPPNAPLVLEELCCPKPSLVPFSLNGQIPQTWAPRGDPTVVQREAGPYWRWCRHIPGWKSLLSSSWNISTLRSKPDPAQTSSSRGAQWGVSVQAARGWGNRGGRLGRMWAAQHAQGLALFNHRFTAILLNSSEIQLN